MQSCFGHHFMLVLEKQEQQFFAIVQLIGTRQQAEKFGFLHIINTGSAANPILLDYLSGKLITGQEHDR